MELPPRARARAFLRALVGRADGGVGFKGAVIGELRRFEGKRAVERREEVLQVVQDWRSVEEQEERAHGGILCEREHRRRRESTFQQFLGIDHESANLQLFEVRREAREDGLECGRVVEVDLLVVTPEAERTERNTELIEESRPAHVRAEESQRAEVWESSDRACDVQVTTEPLWFIVIENNGYASEIRTRGEYFYKKRGAIWRQVWD